MLAHSTLAIDIYGKVLREVKVHMYEFFGCTEILIHGVILREVKGLIYGG